MTLDLGIDVVNDGELPRENYFLHFVRKIKGIDADNLVAKTVRNGKFSSSSTYRTYMFSLIRSASIIISMVFKYGYYIL